jgi:hypothetical protein
MKVVAIELSTTTVRIVLVEGDKTTFDVPYREEWSLASPKRCDDYVEIRKRAVDRIQKWKPDVVCIKPLEPMALRRASGGMIQTAELRGVLTEAAAAAGFVVEFPYKASVNGHFGGGAKGFARSDVEWVHLGADFLKKFRPAATLAVSRLRTT